MAWVKDEPYRNTAFPQWEGLVNNLKEAAEGASTGAIIAAESVKASQIEKPAALAAFGGAKGEQKASAVSPAKKVVISLNAKETEPAYKKIKHSLGTEYPIVQVYKKSTKTSVKIEKIVAENTNEFEIELNGTIADKEEFYIVVTG